jgi:hypothetical protein
MDDLYETNFQSNGELCKIHIRYTVIHNMSTKWSLLEFAIYIYIYIEL